MIPAPTVTEPDRKADPLGWCLDYVSSQGHLYRAFRAEVDKRLDQYPDARISADAVMHFIRWQTPNRATGALFAIDNSAVALFARLYVYQRPQYKANFEFRRSWLDDLDPDSKWRLAKAVDALDHVEQPRLIDKANRWTP